MRFGTLLGMVKNSNWTNLCHSFIHSLTETQFIFKQSLCSLTLQTLVFNNTIRPQHLKINNLTESVLLEMKLPALLK